LRSAAGGLGRGGSRRWRCSSWPPRRPPPARSCRAPRSPRPGFARALGELRVGATAFAELPAAAHLVGLLVGAGAPAGAYTDGLQLERVMISLAVD